LRSDIALRALCHDPADLVEVAQYAGSCFGVWVQAADAVAALRVVDDGPGVGTIRAQHSLGPATVRGVVDGCGGRLRRENDPAGGAVATIELPLAVRGGTS
jgi:signal transduction histidine kinase